MSTAHVIDMEYRLLVALGSTRQVTSYMRLPESFGCHFKLPKPGISHIIFIFCTTAVVQNTKITWEIPGAAITVTKERSSQEFLALFSYILYYFHSTKYEKYIYEKHLAPEILPLQKVTTMMTMHAGDLGGSNKAAEKHYEQ